MPTPNGAIIWQGVSLIDGTTPIVAIVTGLASGSGNRKTGAMAQTWIIRSDMLPTDAVTSRADVGICGGCIHRKQASGSRTCYVNVGQAPQSIYRAFMRGRYPVISPDDAGALLAGRPVRLGAYGDPMAVPPDVWNALTRLASGRTGYTHQWRAPRAADYAHLVQASCETARDVVRANSRGFGTFAVLPVGAPVPPDSLHCPASAERGKLTTCDQCLACDGASRRNVVIHAHGSQARRYLPVL